LWQRNHLILVMIEVTDLNWPTLQSSKRRTGIVNVSSDQDKCVWAVVLYDLKRKRNEFSLLITLCLDCFHLTNASTRSVACRFRLFDALLRQYNITAIVYITVYVCHSLSDSPWTKRVRLLLMIVGHFQHLVLPYRSVTELTRNCETWIYLVNWTACADFPNVADERHIFGGAHPGGCDPQIRSRPRFLYNAPTPPSFVILFYSFGSYHADKQTDRCRWKHPTLFVTLRRWVMSMIAVINHAIRSTSCSLVAETLCSWPFITVIAAFYYFVLGTLYILVYLYESVHSISPTVVHLSTTSITVSLNSPMMGRRLSVVHSVYILWPASCHQYSLVRLHPEIRAVISPVIIIAL